MKKIFSILILVSAMYALDQGEIIGAKLKWCPLWTNVVGASTNLYTNVVLCGSPSSVSYLRSYGSVRDISFSNELILSLSTSGPGGLDTGTLGTNSLYAVYVIADSHRRNKSNTMLMLSANMTTPLLPTNASGVNYAWDIYRRVGAIRTVYTNGGSATNAIPFYQVGEGRKRTMVYDAPRGYTALTMIVTGTNEYYASVSVSNFVPVDCKVLLNCSLTYSTTNMTGALYISPRDEYWGTGLSTIAGNALGIPDEVAPGVYYFDTSVLSWGRAFKYRVSAKENTAAIYVVGYDDEL